MKYLIILLFLTGCSCSFSTSSSQEDIEEESAYKMSCSKLGGYLKRCENIEVVCYAYYSNGGLQCFKKEGQS